MTSGDELTLGGENLTKKPEFPEIVTSASLRDCSLNCVTESQQSAQMRQKIINDDDLNDEVLSGMFLAWRVKALEKLRKTPKFRPAVIKAMNENLHYKNLSNLFGETQADQLEHIRNDIPAFSKLLAKLYREKREKMTLETARLERRVQQTSEEVKEFMKGRKKRKAAHQKWQENQKIVTKNADKKECEVEAVIECRWSHVNNEGRVRLQGSMPSTLSISYANEPTAAFSFVQPQTMAPIIEQPNLSPLQVGQSSSVNNDITDSSSNSADQEGSPKLT